MFVCFHLVGMFLDTGNASALAGGRLAAAAAAGSRVLELESVCHATSGGMRCRPPALTPVTETGQFESPPLYFLVADASGKRTLSAEQVRIVLVRALPGVMQTGYSTVVWIDQELQANYPAGTPIVTADWARMSQIPSVASLTPQGDIFGLRIPVVSGIWAGAQSANSVTSALGQFLTMDYPIMQSDHGLVNFIRFALSVIQVAVAIRFAIFLVSLLRGIGS